MTREKRMTGATVCAVALCVLSWVSVSFAGESPKIDSTTSIEQVKTLAESGNSDAMVELGERLMRGQGVDTNATLGLSWIQKAADAGNHQAWYSLGFVYANEVGVKTDMALATNYFRKGAEAGNADCQAIMGMLYQAGDKFPTGLKADPVEAIKWYRLAADQNMTEAIQHLAMMCARGMGVPQDHTAAEKWFRKGAELGNADCIWGLGQCYLDGSGVPQDTVMAYALFSASLDGVKNPEQKQAMTERRDKLGKDLTADQLKKAQPIIEQWGPKD